MLHYLLETLEHCSPLYAIVVATSTEENDTPIADYCRGLGLAFHRGSLDDVAGRFVEVLDLLKCDAFVRLNGDSPLLDYRLVDRAVSYFRSGRLDVVTNVLRRTFPKGQSVEVVASNVFKRTYPLFRTSHECEHVTPYFYEREKDFSIHNFESERDYGRIQLSVDTCEDMKRLEAVVTSMNRPHWEYGYEELVRLIDSSEDF